jgi:hypothetical protein
MKWFLLRPPIAGDIYKSSADWRAHPPVFEKLHYEINLPLDDAIIAHFPVWVVTAPAKAAIEAAGLSGVSFDTVEISESANYEALWPDQKPPECAWLKVHGTAGHDDFGTHDFELVISARALKLLRQLGVPNAEVKVYKEG